MPMFDAVLITFLASFSLGVWLGRKFCREGDAEEIKFWREMAERREEELLIQNFRAGYVSPDGPDELTQLMHQIQHLRDKRKPPRRTHHRPNHT